MFLLFILYNFDVLKFVKMIMCSDINKNIEIKSFDLKKNML